jgi:hypothetical protein
MGKRTAALVATILLTSSCARENGEAPQPDCEAIERKIWACMDEAPGSSAYEVLVECADAYSGAERIEGTWSSDFEQWVSLLMPASSFDLTEDAKGEPQAAVYYLEFIGRRPLCPSPLMTSLVVDRVLSRRLIEIRPYGWTYHAR